MKCHGVAILRYFERRYVNIGCFLILHISSCEAYSDVIGDLQENDVITAGSYTCRHSVKLKVVVFLRKMFSTDADGAKRKVQKHHKKAGWPSKRVECTAQAYSCPAAAMMLSRPRSATPTMHDQIMMDRNRVRIPAAGPGTVADGPGSPYRQPAGSTPKRQHEGRSQRSQSSDHHRSLVGLNAVYILRSDYFYGERKKTRTPLYRYVQFTPPKPHVSLRDPDSLSAI